MYFGIIGGGFGVYGWLSALNYFSEIKIGTLAKYKKKILNKPDIENLSTLVEKINWFDEEDLLFQSVDILIIARRPVDQVKVINHLIQKSWKGSLIIEKPIAASSDESKKMIKKMIKNKISFQVGFSIMETNWSKKIQQLILNTKPKEISIDWNFYAHHYKYNDLGWKSNPYFGGGALSFYSIHFIAWLSSFSDWNVNYCSPLKIKNNDPYVDFELTNGNTILKMKCNSISENLNLFTITEKVQNRLVLNLENPFSETLSKNNILKIDARVPYLIKIIEKALQNNWIDYSFLEKHINLWKAIENKRNGN